MDYYINGRLSCYPELSKETRVQNYIFQKVLNEQPDLYWLEIESKIGIFGLFRALVGFLKHGKHKTSRTI